MKINEILVIMCIVVCCIIYYLIAVFTVGCSFTFKCFCQYALLSAVWTFFIFFHIAPLLKNGGTAPVNYTAMQEKGEWNY